MCVSACFNGINIILWIYILIWSLFNVIKTFFSLSLSDSRVARGFSFIKWMKLIKCTFANDSLARIWWWCWWKKITKLARAPIVYPKTPQQFNNWQLMNWTNMKLIFLIIWCFSVCSVFVHELCCFVIIIIILCCFKAGQMIWGFFLSLFFSSFFHFLDGHFRKNEKENEKSKRSKLLFIRERELLSLASKQSSAPKSNLFHFIVFNFSHPSLLQSNPSFCVSFLSFFPLVLWYISLVTFPTYTQKNVKKDVQCVLFFLVLYKRQGLHFNSWEYNLLLMEDGSGEILRVRYIFIFLFFIFSKLGLEAGHCESQI